MRGIGSDLLALACIFGSATASGALTLTLLDRANGPDAPEECQVQALRSFAVSPRIVVTRGEGRRSVIVSTPRVQLFDGGRETLVVPMGSNLRKSPVVSGVFMEVREEDGGG